jgi:hypothetical protein
MIEVRSSSLLVHTIKKFAETLYENLVNPIARRAAPKLAMLFVCNSQPVSQADITTVVQFHLLFTTGQPDPH